jgi:hypothetical protein
MLFGELADAIYWRAQGIITKIQDAGFHFKRSE